MKRIPYVPSEDAILRALWPRNSGADVAALIDRTVASVDNRAFKLGLHKTAEYTARTSATFRPGFTPWNAGKPGSTGTHPNTRRTQFAKGRPASEARNYLPIGSERITSEGMLERKVTDDPSIAPTRRWVAVSRLVWEEANGPIPDGHAVVFLPGRASTDVARITPDSVELVTRAELMRRNSYHNRYPKEVAKLIQLRGALTRKINRRSKAA